MTKTIADAEKYGQMTKIQKRRMVDCIIRHGYLPSKLREKVWLLCSGAERAKRNNPNYYMIREKKR